ncbi:MAG: hypothetical protein KIT80_23470 [Chitinophagaceae bacterium]|nr:hypothetical protein [Nitrosomonas sp.]MCW5929900.1 hypothetical protein [Chitinophagaceae bacterium]
MSNEYGYGVVDSENNPVLTLSNGGFFYKTKDAADVYIEMANSIANLNDYKNTPWRVVKLTWSEIDE